MTTTLGEQAMLRVAGEAAHLLRSARRSTHTARGEWNVAEMGVHMLHVLDFELGTVRRDPVPPVYGFDDLSRFTVEYVVNSPVRDLPALADRIEAAAAELAAITAGLGPDHEFDWFAGSRLPLRAIHAHIVSELLVHGLDVARAEKLPWTIRPQDALIAVDDFVVPLNDAFARAGSFGGGTAFVNQKISPDFSAVYRIQLTGGPPRDFSFAARTLAILEPSPSRRVDCHVHADPAALLLVVWRRRSHWPAVATFKLRARGRKPWLAAKLPTLFHVP
ncbi:MAG: hypothetical protein ACT4QG_07410 [Sporichthyaceae bacterium]